MTTCNICAAPIRKTNKLVVCEKCDHEACSSCTEKYITMSLNEPQCMKCNYLWDSVFLHKTHTKACISRIKTSQKERLFNLETTLLPETQEFLPLYNELPILNKTIQDNQHEMVRINRRNYTERNSIRRASNYRDYYTVLYNNAIHNDRLRRIHAVINGFRDTLYLLEEEAEEHSEEQFTKVRNEYVKKCGQQDCNGYVNKRTYRCGVCETEICKHCWVEKSNEEDASPHVCNRDDIATTKAILKDSKPCPECYAPIHRIDGCNHMFCTQCTTAFDWRTGEIHKNGNTNPHYYAWIQTQNVNNPPTSSNQGCNDHRVGVQDAILAIQRSSLSVTDRNNTASILRNFAHITNYERPTVLTEAERLNQNRPLRINFLTKKITEKEMKTKLMKKYKANECNIHKSQLADMVDEVRFDFMNRFIRNQQDPHQVYTELQEFKTYVVDCYKKIENVYGLKCYKFTN